MRAYFAFRHCKACAKISWQSSSSSPTTLFHSKVNIILITPFGFHSQRANYSRANLVFRIFSPFGLPRGVHWRHYSLRVLGVSKRAVPTSTSSRKRHPVWTARPPPKNSESLFSFPASLPQLLLRNTTTKCGPTQPSLFFSREKKRKQTANIWRPSKLRRTCKRNDGENAKKKPPR